MPKRKGSSKGKESNQEVVSNGIDPGKLWSTLVTGKGDKNFLASTAQDLTGLIGEKVQNLKEYGSEVVGGAKALAETVSKGDFGIISDWIQSEETPFIAKASGLAAVAGGLIVGGFVAVKGVLVTGGMLATSSLGTLLANLGVTVLVTRLELVEKSFNFFETAVEVNFDRTTDKFIQDTVKEAKEALKAIAVDLIGLGGRSLARVAVDQFGKHLLEVDKRTLGILSLTQSAEQYDDTISTLTGIGGRLGSLGKKIATEGALLMSRDMLADWGVPGVTKGSDKAEFTLSSNIEKEFKKVASANDVPEWLAEALYDEGREEAYDTFRELAVDRAGEIDSTRRVLDYNRMNIRFV